MNVSAQYIFHSDSIIDGIINEQFLREHYAWFQKGYDNYKPKSSDILKLQSDTEGLSFKVVMGSWCSDSREHIPAFFQVMNSIGIKPEQIELIGTLKNKQSTKTDISKLHIEFVPTIIVFYEGKELGRIIENTKKSMENDLLKIIRKK